MSEGETDYRENKTLQDNAENCLDGHSDEYICMEDTQSMYEEVQQRDYEMTESPSPQRDYCVKGSTKSINRTEKGKNEVEYIYSNPKSRRKIEWSFPYSKHYLGQARIGTLQSSVGNSSCVSYSHTSLNTFTPAFSDFLEAFQQQLMGYCELEKKRLTKYQRLDVDPASCSEVLHQNSSAESGYYLLRSLTGQLTSVFCDMTTTCGNITGGWMRIAELEVTSCPVGLKSKTFDGIRTCVVNEDAPGCTSVSFSSFNIPFSKICGQIRGYGVGTVDGMRDRRFSRESNVSDNYLDGVSLTIADTHVWSFVAGGCECNNTPHFITTDWTCDGDSCSSGNFCGDYLWNSSTCGETTPFLKYLPNATMSELTMRVCRDEARVSEDIALSNIELFVH